MGDRIDDEEVGPSIGVGSYGPAQDHPRDQMDIPVSSPGYARGTRLQFTILGSRELPRG